MVNAKFQVYRGVMLNGNTSDLKQRLLETSKFWTK